MKGPNYHPSHKPAPRRHYKPRTVETIKRRNNAMVEIYGRLGRGRPPLMTNKGELR